MTTATPATSVISSESSSAAGEERTAGVGDGVSVHYHGTLDDGEVFDSSRQRAPLDFVVGGGQMITGFDQAVRGLAVGDLVTVRIEPEEAYGIRDERLILEFPSADAPEGIQVGDQVQLSNGQRAVVIELTHEIVRIDANHALAGQALTFEIELVAIR